MRIVFPSAASNSGSAIAAQAAFLIVVNHIRDWDWLPWLTDDFDDVAGIMSIALIASMLANLIYLLFPIAYATRWSRSALTATSVGITLAAAVRLYQVFPFDFDRYSFNWDTLTRAVLIFLIVSMTLGLLFHLVQLIAALARPDTGDETPPTQLHA